MVKRAQDTSERRRLVKSLEEYLKLRKRLKPFDAWMAERQQTPQAVAHYHRLRENLDHDIAAIAKRVEQLGGFDEAGK